MRGRREEHNWLCGRIPLLRDSGTAASLKKLLDTPDPDGGGAGGEAAGGYYEQGSGYFGEEAAGTGAGAGGLLEQQAVAQAAERQAAEQAEALTAQLANGRGPLAPARLCFVCSSYAAGNVIGRGGSTVQRI